MERDGSMCIEEHPRGTSDHHVNQDEVEMTSLLAQSSMDESIHMVEENTIDDDETESSNPDLNQTRRERKFTKPRSTRAILFMVALLTILCAIHVFRNSQIYENNIKDNENGGSRGGGSSSRGGSPHTVTDKQLVHVNVAPKETNNVKPKFCFFTTRSNKGHIFKSCPNTRTDYVLSCKEEANKRYTKLNIHSPLPGLIDASNFIPRLLQFFHGKRVAIVGDSVSRQWYESLSCRLGMNPVWFRKGDVPQFLGDWYNSSDIILRPMNNSPRNHRHHKVYGYASSTSKEKKNEHENHHCKRFWSRLEYYHVNDFHEAKNSISKTLNAISDRNDITIINIGAHYAFKMDVFEEHVQEVMKVCGELNNNGNGKRCYFRETLPAHFQDKSMPCGEFTEALKQIRPKERKCGPITGTSPMNANLTNYASEYNVTIIDGTVLNNAWNWHRTSDCRHYCQDNEVWDLIHESLLNAADVV